MGGTVHLIVDGYGENTQLDSEETVRQFLETYPDVIGMTKIAPPFVYRYSGSKQTDYGVSGFVLIAESHISVHTFPARGYINIDIFSCKPFDDGKAVEEIKRLFALKSVKTWILDRGLEQFAQPSLSPPARRTP
ncbi:MAG: S-adenosylmethionine decarboxylase [Chloroflexi bacterium]|nr:S-adenosylmethionine decarboxylase [Chloroflexota bacterium]